MKVFICVGLLAIAFGLGVYAEPAARNVQVAIEPVLTAHERARAAEVEIRRLNEALSNARQAAEQAAQDVAEKRNDLTCAPCPVAPKFE